MKKLSLLTLCAAVFMSGGLSATLPGYISDIFVINKTDKDMTVGPRTQSYYGWNGQRMYSKQVGGTLVVKTGDRVKIASLERDQLLFISRYALVSVEFTVNGQKQSFDSKKTRIAVASTLTYDNPTHGIKDLKLPVEMQGLKITPKFVFGKTYQDVEMEFYPGYTY